MALRFNILEISSRIRELFKIQNRRHSHTQKRGGGREIDSLNQGQKPQRNVFTILRGKADGRSPMQIYKVKKGS